MHVRPNKMPLHQALSQKFSLDELHGLCFSLGWDWESIPFAIFGKEAYTFGMVKTFSELNRLSELLAACIKVRPNVDWTNLTVIADNFIGRNVIIKGILQGFGDLPKTYDSSVKAFLDYYLGTPDKPAPFGGREGVLRQLSDWLNDENAPPYALLTAPMGYGKSALLAHWVTRLQTSAIDHIVYFPISMRWDTHTEFVVYSALAARLSRILDDKPLVVMPQTTARQYRELVHEFLHRTLKTTQRLLLVIDALDEADGWEAVRLPFPEQPSNNLRVLVSARLMAGDVDGSNWRKRLHWDEKRSRLISLNLLDEAGVHDVLKQMGSSFDTLAANFDIVFQLYKLSEGDPLLVRWYVETLLEKASCTPQLDVSDLLALRPGLSAFIGFYFTQLEKLAQTDSLARITVIRALACAHGALSVDDLLQLAPQELGSINIDAVVAQLSRFLVGNGRKVGFSFNHPRLRQFFREDDTHQIPKSIIADWSARYLQYGRKTLDALNRNILAPKDVSSYIVHYYCTHLDEAKAKPQDFYDLMSEGWLRAWEQIDTTVSGFLEVCYRAQAAARREGPPALGQIIRAGLCSSSIASISTQIPTDLLVTCVRAGVIGSMEAYTYSCRKLKQNEQIESLIVISSYISSEQQIFFLKQALAVAYTIRDKHKYVNAICAIARYLPRNQQSVVLDEISKAANAIENELDRAYALNVITEQMMKDQEHDVLHEQLGDTNSASYSEAHIQFVPSAGVNLTHDQQTEALHTVLAANQEIKDDYARFAALSALAAQLPSEHQTPILFEWLIAASANLNQQNKHSALRAVASYLPEHFYLLEDKLENASGIRSPSVRFGNLTKAPIILPIEQQPAVQRKSATPTIQSKDLHPDFLQRRNNSLDRIAARLMSNQMSSTMREELKAARGIPNNGNRAVTLSFLAAHLPKDQQPVLLREALESANIIEDATDRAHTLCAVAEHFPDDQRLTVLDEALTAARAIHDDGSRASTLGALADYLPRNQQLLVLNEALSITHDIQEEDSRALTLSAVARRLPSDQPELLHRALMIAHTFESELDRANALKVVAERLPDNQSTVLDEIWMAARNIEDKSSHASVLLEVAAHSPSDKQSAILREVWESVRYIEDIGTRESILGYVATGLNDNNLALLDNTLDLASRGWRSGYLRVIENAAPAIARLGGERAVRETAQAIIDIANWWP